MKSSHILSFAAVAILTFIYSAPPAFAEGATTFYWRGTTSTDWTIANNWSPEPPVILGTGDYDNRDVVIEAATNMPVMPSSTDITIVNMLINSGNSCTGSGGNATCTVEGQISGGGLFTGGTGTLKLLKVGTGANAPIVLGFDQFNDSVGTISYEGAGNQEIWADCTDWASKYYNLKLAGSGTKSFNGNNIGVQRQLIVDGVTCSFDNGSQYVRVNPWRYNQEPAVELTGSSVVTGDGCLQSWGNCNVASAASINNLSQFRLYARNDGTNIEHSHLNVSSGASVSVTMFWAFQYGSDANPINFYFNGPGTLDVSGNLYLYSLGGDLTFWVNGNMTCGSLRPEQTTTTFDDLGAYTITANQAYGPGDITLDSGGDLTLTGTNGLWITGTLTIAHSGSVVDVDGNFTPGTLVMSAGELYIADNNPSWTWGSDPTGGTIYYDGTTQDIANPSGADYSFDYWNLNLCGSGTKNITGQHVDIRRNLTVDGATFSIDNLSQYIRCNYSRYDQEPAVDITGSGTITGEGYLQSYGNCNVGSSGTVSVRMFYLLARDTEPAYLTVASGGTVSRDGYGIFSPYSQGSNPCTVTYTGPGTLNYYYIRPYSPTAPLTFVVDGHMCCSELRPYHESSTIDDAGSYTIDAANVYENGNIILDSGTDLNVSWDFTLVGDLTIGHENSSVVVEREFDTTEIIVMSAGELHIKDDDASFNFSSTSLSGGTIFYDSSSAQNIVKATYNNLTLTGSGTKSLIDDIKVKDTARITGNATFTPVSYELMIGTAFDMDNGKFLADTAGATLSRTGSLEDRYTATITGGELDITSLAVWYTDAGGIDVSGSVTFTNFDGITWRNGDPAGRYLKFGDSTNITFTDDNWNGHDFDAYCTYNVECTASGPSKVVLFTNHTGAGAGESFDCDSSSAGVECIWNYAPTTPTVLQINGCGANASETYMPYPKFSVQYNDNSGDIAVAYQIQLLNSTGHVIWDSGKCYMSDTSAGSRTPDIKYTGPDLVTDETYSWRIMLWDVSDAASPWSEPLYFTFVNIWIDDEEEDHFPLHPSYGEYYQIEFDNNDIIPDSLDIIRGIMWQEDNCYNFQITTNGDIQTVFNEFGDNAQFGVALDNNADLIGDLVVLTYNGGTAAALLSGELDVIDYYLDISIEDNSIIISVPGEYLNASFRWDACLSGFAAPPGKAYRIVDVDDVFFCPVVDIAKFGNSCFWIGFDITSSEPKKDKTWTGGIPFKNKDKTLMNESEIPRDRTINIDNDNGNIEDWPLVRQADYDNFDNSLVVEEWGISHDNLRATDQDYIAVFVYRDWDNNGKWDPGEPGGWVFRCPFTGGTSSFWKPKDGLTLIKTDMTVSDDPKDDDGDGLGDIHRTIYYPDNNTITVINGEKASLARSGRMVEKTFTGPFDSPGDIPTRAEDIYEIKTEDLPEGNCGEIHYIVQLESTLLYDDTVNSSEVWSKESGDLPDNLSLSSDGVISGWPTRADTYDFTVMVEYYSLLNKDESENTIIKTKQLQIIINP